jgi:hypothetical protein
MGTLKINLDTGKMTDDLTKDEWLAILATLPEILDQARINNFSSFNSAGFTVIEYDDEKS